MNNDKTMLVNEIEDSSYRWLNITGFSDGNDLLDFMLRSENVSLEDEDIVVIETSQLTFRIYLPKTIEYDKDWDTYDFTSYGIDYVFKFM